MWKNFTEYEYQIYFCLPTWKNTNIEYIHNQIANRIRISNIFVSTNLTGYEYRIYLFLGTWLNTNIEYICSSQSYQISNIFVLSNLAEYEYQIYSKQENWIFVFKYTIIFGGYYSFIRIYSCYTVSESLTKQGWIFFRICG